MAACGQQAFEGPGVRWVVQEPQIQILKACGSRFKLIRELAIVGFGKGNVLIAVIVGRRWVWKSREAGDNGAGDEAAIYKHLGSS